MGERRNGTVPQTSLLARSLSISQCTAGMKSTKEAKAPVGRTEASKTQNWGAKRGQKGEGEAGALNTDASSRSSK